MNDSNTEHAESQLENSDGDTRNVDLIESHRVLRTRGYNIRGRGGISKATRHKGFG